MHQEMRELAVRCEEQQPRRVDVQPPDGDPATVPGRGQPFEYRRPPLRITAGRHLSDWLVVQEELTGGKLRRAQVEPAAVEPNVITRRGTIAELRNATRNGHAAVTNPLF